MPNPTLGQAGIDFMLNGGAHGHYQDDISEQGVGSLQGGAYELLLSSGGDPGILRPWRGKDGRTYVALHNGERDDKRELVRNAYSIPMPSTLRKEEWVEMDEVLERTARPELAAWSRIVGEGLTYNIPNGMAVMVLQYQLRPDFGEAVFSMDGLRASMRDRPTYDLGGLPLPIVHSDASFGLRELMVSRNGPTPLDTTGVEMATRRCAEAVEDLTIGNRTVPSYGGFPVYGLTNHTSRFTKTMTLPTATGWTPRVLIQEVLSMVQSLADVYLKGPYGLWYSKGWTQYLDDDYSDAYGGKTVRQRLGDVGDLKFVEKLDLLTDFQMVLVQLRQTCIRAVTGMPLNTVQWQTLGGFASHFKVLGIMVPQLRLNAGTGVGASTTAAKLGIVHGTAA